MMLSCVEFTNCVLLVDAAVSACGAVDLVDVVCLKKKFLPDESGQQVGVSH